MEALRKRVAGLRANSVQSQLPEHRKTPRGIRGDAPKPMPDMPHAEKITDSKPPT